MADLIESFKEKAKQSRKKIALPEGDDERVITAAINSAKKGFAKPVLIGNREGIREKARQINADVSSVEISDPKESPDFERYVQAYLNSGFGKDSKPSIAQRLISKPVYFAGMMVKSGDADGLVGGCASPTATIVRAGMITIGLKEGVSEPSSIFVMVLKNSAYGANGTLVYADAGVMPDPNAEQLAEIAVLTARSTKLLLEVEPKVAMLSFSTKGSASHPLVEKVVKATQIAKQRAPELLIDGELQADSAIVERVAKKKVKESAVAGMANVLIFPNLDAGNIAYKLTQYLAGAEAYGPILQGFEKPVNDLSRGATAEDIEGVIAITAVESAIGF